MASWSTPVTHATGNILAVTDWNGVANNETFLYQAPYANYYGSVTTSVPSGSVTLMGLQATSNANYGFSLVSNAAKVPIAGTYISSFLASCSSGAGSGGTYFGAAVEQQGTLMSWGSFVPSYSATPTSGGSLVLACNASDAITLVAFQNSGSSLPGSTGSNLVNLSLAFVGSL